MQTLGNSDATSAMITLSSVAKKMSKLLEKLPPNQYINGDAPRSLLRAVQDLEILYLDREDYLDMLALQRILPQLIDELEHIAKQADKTFKHNPIRWSETGEIQDGLGRIEIEIGKLYRRMLTSSDDSATARARQMSTRYNVPIASKSVQELKSALQEAAKNLSSYVALLKDPVIVNMQPRSLDVLKAGRELGVLSNLSAYIKSWEGKPSLRIGSFYLYAQGSNTPQVIENSNPVTTYMSISAQDHTILGNGVEGAQPFSIRGERYGLRIFFRATYPTQIYRYEGIFTPWGVVGNWMCETNSTWLGVFNAWIADAPQDPEILEFGRSIV